MTFNYDAAKPRTLRGGKTPDIEAEQPAKPRQRRKGKEPDAASQKAKHDKNMKPAKPIFNNIPKTSSFENDNLVNPQNEKDIQKLMDLMNQIDPD